LPVEVERRIERLRRDRNLRPDRIAYELRQSKAAPVFSSTRAAARTMCRAANPVGWEQVDVHASGDSRLAVAR
jgi:hypothetical protein